MEKDIFEVILTILVIISFIVVIFMLLWKIFGKSPSDVGLLTAAVVGLTLYTIRTEYSRGKFEGEFREFKRSVGKGFVRVREDMGELKSSIGDVKKNLEEIRDLKK